MKMVDVGGKRKTERVAVASAFLRMLPATLERIREGKVGKGDVLGVARLAGIMAAKRTSDLIPLCHPLMISKVTVDLVPAPPDAVEIEVVVKLKGQTGVEMEALTAVTVALLTVYDRAKAVDRGMILEEVRLVEKTGGASGPWRA